MSITLPAAAYLAELQSEAVSTRKCLERIDEKVFAFKPHPRSMTMGYLALLVAEIPLWITLMIEQGEIDFASFKHFEAKNAQDLVSFFDNNMQGVTKALQQVSEEELEQPFYLKSNGQVLFSVTKKDYIGPTINHWVHHRGQLTVFMRICDIPVPSIYGPSADDRSF